MARRRITSARAIVIIGGGRTFIAGADIKELELAASGRGSGPPEFHGILARIEDSTKPVVMAIHGTALGGGWKSPWRGIIAWRFPTPRLGQPEVNLGIIPGAEGTQRLPRLVGMAAAVEMCVSGKPIRAPEALQLGLIDRVIEGDLLTGAIAFAREIADQGGRSTQDARAERQAGCRIRGRIDFRGRARAGAQDAAQYDRAFEGRRRHRSRRHSAIRRGLQARTRDLRGVYCVRSSAGR